MTARAARLLAALEAGCETREQIFQHQGRFSLLNNGAAELRAAGIDVECVLEDGDYHYRLIQDRGLTRLPCVAPTEATVRGDTPHGDTLPPANPDGGLAQLQMTWTVAA